jgi:hypothetical protein
MLKVLFLFSISALFLFGCEEKNDDKIYKAQRCLDNSTSETVDNCVEMVSGITSGQAYQIRCSADFLRADINNDTILDAIEELDNDNGSSSDATVTFFKFFKFEDTAAADVAIENCTLTGSQTYRDLALAAKTATIMNGLTGGQDLDQWIDSLNPGSIDSLSEEELEDLGETVIALHPSLCGEGGDFEDNPVCDEIGAVIDEPNAVELAKALLLELKND